MKYSIRQSSTALSLAIIYLLLPSFISHAQETDITQTPNTANAGIKKSLAEQIGEGRGNVDTPDSSLYIINRDPFRSIRRGRNLFQRKFTVAQGFGPRTGDGRGDIETEGSIGAGLADSCAACHGRPRGSAGFGGDVFTRPDSRDAPHLFGLGLVEMLADEITQDLRTIKNTAMEKAQRTGRRVQARLKSKGISYGTIKALPDGSVDTTRVQGVNPDLRVRPFFHQGETISIREFIVGALNAEMGLEAFDEDLAKAVAGAKVTTPSGMVLDGSIDKIEAPPAISESDDPDLDGLANEIPVSLVDHMEFYLLNYFKPAHIGKRLEFELGEKFSNKFNVRLVTNKTWLLSMTEEWQMLRLAIMLEKASLIDSLLWPRHSFKNKQDPDLHQSNNQLANDSSSRTSSRILNGIILDQTSGNAISMERLRRNL